MPRRHPLADVHAVLHVYFHHLTGLRALGGGQVPHEDWRTEVTERLKFRWSSKRPATLGWHSEGRTSITLFPDATPGMIAETMLHELVHAADLAVDVRLRSASEEDHRKHGPSFWKAFNRAAHDAFDVEESYLFRWDGHLGYYLDDEGWRFPGMEAVK